MLSLRAAGPILSLAVLFGFASAASAATSYEPGSAGWDVSWPQCGSALPKGGEFAIVGVNRGIAFSANPCFAKQLAWADALPEGASVYVNTANPGTLSDSWEERSGCADEASVDDPVCAYAYGQAAAAYSVGLLLDLSLSPSGFYWWLDVETANSWEGTHEANTAAIHGYIDYLRSQGVNEIGVYSTEYQWGVITGGESLGDFVSDLKVWLAGARSQKTAAGKCDAGFAGGDVLLVQYFAKGFDGNLVCGGEPGNGNGAGGRPDNPGRPNQ